MHRRYIERFLAFPLSLPPWRLLLLPPLLQSQVLDDASPRLYENLHGLMSAVLCDPITSPFLEPTTTSAGTSDGRDRAIITSERQLLGGLACLVPHEDLGQRALLLVGLDLAWAWTPIYIFYIIAVFWNFGAGFVFILLLLLFSRAVDAAAPPTSFFNVSSDRFEGWH